MTNATPEKAPEGNVVEVRDLVVGFDTDDGRVIAVDGVSFDVPKGKTLGIVGESGCGKSVTALSMMRLLPQPMGTILGGSIRLNGEDLVTASEARMHGIRGAEIGMIFQEPMTALNPVLRIGEQVREVFRLHLDISRKEAHVRAVEILRRVGIPSPEIRMGEYPHQLSGGMRQRVVIAMALACRPKLIIADEPTTALDVTIQAQILDLLKDLQEEIGMSVVLITHDLGVIAETCDEVVVMYAGRVVERAPVEAIFRRPLHAYTKGLLDSIPRLETPRKTPLSTIAGMVPSLKNLPVGVRFAPRSGRPYTEEELRVRPPFKEIEPDHWVEYSPSVYLGNE
jgi:oligopeptide/dipeptide ABC transporter ATP-binding protein